jgi:hypothetical protein
MVCLVYRFYVLLTLLLPIYLKQFPHIIFGFQLLFVLCCSWFINWLRPVFHSTFLLLLNRGWLQSCLDGTEQEGVIYYFIIHVLQGWVISSSLLGTVPSPGYELVILSTSLKRKSDGSRHGTGKWYKWNKREAKERHKLDSRTKMSVGIQ